MVIKHFYKATLIALIGSTLLASAPLANASDLTIPNDFSSGDTTSASEVNDNFTAIENAVNDNDTRLDAIESGSTRVVFQGFSGDSVTGNQGICQLQAACSATFTASKICTSEEYSNSIYNAGASNLAGEAWLIPTTLSASSSKIRDLITGNTYGSGGLSCRGYSHSGTGLTVSAVGEIETTSCSDSIPVACCK